MAYREIALGGRNPQIGAAGVENHREVLRRRADPDLPEVLSIHVVLEGDNVAAIGSRGFVQARIEAETISVEGEAILTRGWGKEPLGTRQPRREPAVLVQRPLLQPDPDETVGRDGEAQRDDHKEKKKACRKSFARPHRAGFESSTYSRGNKKYRKRKFHIYIPSNLLISLFTLLSFSLCAQIDIYTPIKLETSEHANVNILA